MVARAEHGAPAEEGVVEGVGLALARVAEDGDHLAAGGGVAAEAGAPRGHGLHAEHLVLVQHQEGPAVVPAAVQVEALEVVSDHIGHTGLAARGGQHRAARIPSVITTNIN